MRLEVKNTRRTLVLSKVKCVSRQREELKITRVYTQQILGSPGPPFLGQSQKSICGRKGDSLAKAPGHLKPYRGISGVLPALLPCPVLKAHGLGGGEGQALCWVAPGQLGHLGTSYSLRMTPPVCVMVTHAGGGTPSGRPIHPLPRRVLSARCCIMGGYRTDLLQTPAGLENPEETNQE